MTEKKQTNINIQNRGVGVGVKNKHIFAESLVAGACNAL